MKIQKEHLYETEQMYRTQFRIIKPTFPLKKVIHLNEDTAKELGDQQKVELKPVHHIRINV